MLPDGESSRGTSVTGSSLETLLPKLKSISEEQAWAICFLTSLALLERNPPVDYELSLTNVSVTARGTVFICDNAADKATDDSSSARGCSESDDDEDTGSEEDSGPLSEEEVVASLGMLIYDALDYGLHEDAERELSPEIQELIEKLTTEADEDAKDGDAATATSQILSKEDGSAFVWSSGAVTARQLIKVCEFRANFKDRPPVAHCQDICRQMVQEADVLALYRDAAGEYIKGLDFLEEAPRSLVRNWRDVVREVIEGNVRLTPATQTKCFAAVQAMLLEQLRRGGLVKSLRPVEPMVKSPRIDILKDIRQGLHLKPAEERVLSEKVSEKSRLEELMDAISDHEAVKVKLRSVPDQDKRYRDKPAPDSTTVLYRALRRAEMERQQDLCVTSADTDRAHGRAPGHRNRAYGMSRRKQTPNRRHLRMALETNHAIGRTASFNGHTRSGAEAAAARPDTLDTHYGTPATAGTLHTFVDFKGFSSPCAEHTDRAVAVGDDSGSPPAYRKLSSVSDDGDGGSAAPAFLSASNVAQLLLSALPATSQQSATSPIPETDDDDDDGCLLPRQDTVRLRYAPSAPSSKRSSLAATNSTASNDLDAAAAPSSARPERSASAEPMHLRRAPLRPPDAGLNSLGGHSPRASLRRRVSSGAHSPRMSPRDQQHATIGANGRQRPQSLRRSSRLQSTASSYSFDRPHLEVTGGSSGSSGGGGTSRRSSTNSNLSPSCSPHPENVLGESIMEPVPLLATPSQEDRGSGSSSPTAAKAKASPTLITSARMLARSLDQPMPMTTYSRQFLHIPAPAGESSTDPELADEKSKSLGAVGDCAPQESLDELIESDEPECRKGEELSSDDQAQPSSRIRQISSGSSSSAMPLLMTGGLSYKEIVAIRTKQTNREISSLNDNDLKSRLRNGKVCFVCKKKKFTFFSLLSTRTCILCGRKVCLECITKMVLLDVDFSDSNIVSDLESMAPIEACYGCRISLLDINQQYRAPDECSICE